MRKPKTPRKNSSLGDFFGTLTVFQIFLSLWLKSRRDLKILLNDMQLWVWAFLTSSEHQKRCLNCRKQLGRSKKHPVRQCHSCCLMKKMSDLLPATELSDSVWSMMKRLHEIQPVLTNGFCSPLTEKSPVWLFERGMGGIWPSDYPNTQKSIPNHNRKKECFWTFLSFFYFFDFFWKFLI